MFLKIIIKRYTFMILTILWLIHGHICMTNRNILNTYHILIKLKEDIHLQISNSLVIFCSVRPIKLYIQTLKWLKKINISTSFFQLIFASNPAQKIDFLNIFLELNIPITFYDDMSYNHENGTVLFYENEIAELRKMNIKFFDAKKLKEKQGSIKHLE